jgi:hypothetical protein
VPDYLADLFRRECGADAVLREIAKKLADELPAGAAPTESQLAAVIGERAREHYASLWNECSPLEKLVVLQLAHEDLVNPHCGPVLRRLRQRGLVRATPDIRLMNETFRKFVLSVEPPKDVLALEQARDSAWSVMQRMLWPSILILMIFVAFTQRQLMQGYEAVIPFLAGGLTAIGKLFDLMKVARASPSSGGAQSA